MTLSRSCILIRQILSPYRLWSTMNDRIKVSHQFRIIHVCLDFVTDLEIGGRVNGFTHDEDTFVEWLPDDEMDAADKGQHSSHHGSGGADGWSVEAMFQANRSLGVVSTFEDDLSQYTT